MRSEHEIREYLEEVTGKIEELSGNDRTPSNAEKIILRDMKIRRAVFNWVLAGESPAKSQETPEENKKTLTLKGLW